MKIIDYQFAITMYCLLIFKVKPYIYSVTLCMFVWLCFFLLLFFLSEIFFTHMDTIGWQGKDYKYWFFVYCSWLPSSQILFRLRTLCARYFRFKVDFLSNLHLSARIHFFTGTKGFINFFKLKNMTSVINCTDKC